MLGNFPVYLGHLERRVSAGQRRVLRRDMGVQGFLIALGVFDCRVVDLQQCKDQ